MLAWGDVAVFCLQRIEGRVGALQNAVDEYYKAKNEFAAKVSMTRAAKVALPCSHCSWAALGSVGSQPLDGLLGGTVLSFAGTEPL